MKHSLEYLALHYLDIWLKHDRLYHESFNNGTREEKLRSIKQAVTFYKVARNLPKVHDEGVGSERYGPILKILDNSNASDFSVKTVDAVTNIQKKVSTAYGGRNVLSITTKLLWLKVRSPIIIYDSQARKALNTAERDFSSFYEAWQGRFDKNRKAIAKVCAKLDRVSKYFFDQAIATPAYVQALSSQTWFHERVFDVYLWHEGQ